MVKLLHTLAFSSIFLLQCEQVLSQTTKFGIKEKQLESGSQPSCFAIPNTPDNLAFLAKEKITIKYRTDKWLYITTSIDWMVDNVSKGLLSDYYFKNSTPTALDDSARATHFVDQVHAGTGGLGEAYKGKGVIIGYVDQGIDFNHPDFLNPDGSTRVLRYWDHTLNSGGPASPYGYGIVWDSTAINNGTCISTETGTAHGSTVTGKGSGNGSANGMNAGMAPESSIIVVESNFNLPNWDLTIADACDYIFKVADSLGMPAVINLSLGDYLGSHDGNDPATEAMEAMLDEHGGRIIVCAAGNSGNQGKYHVSGTMTSALDTSFVWVLNNPSGAFGANTILLDIWSDVSETNYEFAFGADRPAPNYGLRGSTDFWTTSTQLGGVIYDTIYNSLGNRIATIEAYPEVVGNNYHLQAFFSNVDSTSYQFRFMTKGVGSYDAWSGAFLGLNTIVSNIPTVLTYPPIVNYQLPDSLQTIVSGWAASEKIITVANVKTRKHHIDNNNNLYTSNIDPVGKLSINSSKGPSRHNVLKPDISASGDVSLAAAPLWLLSNPAYNGVIQQGGWHARNGGTSMASPVVAGIAALYLEKCPIATYESFKYDLLNTAFTDGFTGTIPNFAYGHGKANALDLMLGTQFTADIVGDLEKCADDITLEIISDSVITNYQWNTGSIFNPLMVANGGDYFATIYNERGCRFYTDTHTVVQLEVLAILPIELNGSTLSTASVLPNYQWTLNGVDIQDSIAQQLGVTAPFGTYTCYVVSSDNCISETPPYQISLDLDEQIVEIVQLFPNPARSNVEIIFEHAIDKISFYDSRGSLIKVNEIGTKKYDVSQLPSGTYFIQIVSDNRNFNTKFIK
ncbi:MAG: S8 family peptidase [Bacteroidota bacterium]